MTIAHFSRMSALADRFDALLLDIWGVVMDGVDAYPGAAQCLAELRGAGKTVILLSNAPRREARVAERLGGIGIAPELYTRIVSSGEASRAAVENGRIAGLGRRYFHMGPPRDAGLLEGLEVAETSLGEADFVLNTGLFDDDDTPDRHSGELEAARARGLPMICANPDLEVVRQGGRRALCAGALAEAYAALGGMVYYFGKPYPAVYEHCLALLNGASRERVFAIGDNLKTDIAGAHARGLPTVLVQGGVLAAPLGLEWGQTASPAALERLCRARGVIPDMTIPALVW